MNYLSFSIDPLMLLTAHQEARERGGCIVSVLCGSTGSARAVWGTWLGQQAGGRAWAAGIVAPGYTLFEVRQVINFIALDTAALLFIPEVSDFTQTLTNALVLAQDQPQRSIAVAIEPKAVTDLLQQQMVEGTRDPPVRLALLGGLIVLDQYVESVLNETVLGEHERPLYRSDQEQILHKLLQNTPDLESFMANQRIAGASGKMYEIDLWCPTLQIALEVDGGQHVSGMLQRKQDAKRDADLATAGIVTLRVHAAEIISDPSSVMIYINNFFQTRRREMTHESY